MAKEETKGARDVIIMLAGACGYIGSRLYMHLKEKHTVDAIDLELRGNPGQITNRKADYRRVQHLKDYDAVIMLAGHSSVAQSRAQPMEAFGNNLHGLLALACKLNGQPLIYASSASVYGIRNGIYTNMYDLTKHAGDAAVRLVYANAFGLRFGTVCGTSPNMRWDLMVNAMVKDAVEKGKIYVRNLAARRPILGMRDLCAAVDITLSGNMMPGVYNCASFNSTVGGIAHRISAVMGVPVEELEGDATPAYDFEMPSSFAPGETLEMIVGDLREMLDGSRGKIADRDPKSLPEVPGRSQAALARQS